MACATEITSEDARGFLERARHGQWSFPSSFGRPVERGDTAAWAELASTERAQFADATRQLVESGAHDDAVELAANAWRLWLLAGDVSGGRNFLAIVLDRVNPQPTRAFALALYGDGLLAARSGAHEDSRSRNEAALRIAREVNDPEALTLAHLGLSRVAFQEGAFESARDHAINAREFARELPAALGQAPLHVHAQAMRALGDYDAAATLFEESLKLNRAIGDDGMVDVELHNLGHTEIRRGNGEAAARYFNELRQRTSSDDPYDVALSELSAAATAYARGDRGTANELLRRAEETLAQAAIEFAPDDQAELDWLVAQMAG
jgi:ATP/maltotriose-dependent transcriptional regulator MalT